MTASTTLPFLLLLLLGASPPPIPPTTRTSPTATSTSTISSAATASTSSLSPSDTLAHFVAAICLVPSEVVQPYIPMMAPLPGLSIKAWHRRQRIDHVLDKCREDLQWKDENDDASEDVSSSSSSSSPSTSSLSSFNPSTYGEITPVGVRQLLQAMGLSITDKDGEDSYCDHPIHFVDLGSGNGQLVGQFALELVALNDKPSSSYNIKHRVTGVELSLSRHQTAIHAMDFLRKQLQLQRRRRLRPRHDEDDEEDDKEDQYAAKLNLNNIDDNVCIQLIQGDLFEFDLSTATHVYVSSLCFPPNLMTRLEDQLFQQHLLGAGASASPQTNKHKRKLQWVASLQRFPNDLGGLRPFVRYMEMSWTRPFGCPVYLYRLLPTSSS